MARVLQGLIAALVLASLCGVGQQQPNRIKFSHALHTKLGDIGPVLNGARKSGAHLRPGTLQAGSGCAACHSATVADQRHDPMVMMGDCLVCHPKIDPPFSCSFCHTADAQTLKPSYHTNDFLDKHTSGLAKLSLNKSDCAVCHGRKFTCLGCH